MENCHTEVVTRIRNIYFVVTDELYQEKACQEGRDSKHVIALCCKFVFYVFSDKNV